MTDHNPANARAQEPQPRGVDWHDLTAMTCRDQIRELCLPLPWLVASLVLYASPVWYLGAGATFMFYLCALRLNHEAIHGNLGFSRRGDRLILHVLSFLMGGSNNAVAYGHLLHHKDTMGPQDFEGKCGHMTIVQVLRYGPRFNWDITREAWAASGPDARRRIAIDWALNAVLIGLAIVSGAEWLMLHVVAIWVGLCLTAFFAVWITHRGAEAHGIIARSQRGLLARLAYLMFYHREHHLFPKVPVARLPDLAERLDRGVPGYAAAHLPVVPWFEPPRTGRDSTITRRRLAVASTRR